MVHPATLLPGFPDRTELVERYAAASGRDPSPALGFWHALALWKVGIIGQGVRRRRTGDASDPGPSRELVEALLDRAERVADEANL